MTANDFDFAYWGEPASADELRCMSFVCPHCAAAGHSLTDLYEHVRVEHARATYEVICPVCACTPNADPNNMTDDLATHLAADHINAAAGGVSSYGAPTLAQRHFRARGRGRTVGSLAANGGVRAAAVAAGRPAQGRSSTGTAAAAADVRTSQVAEMLQQLGTSGGRSGNGYLRLLRSSFGRRDAGRSNAGGGADRARLNVVNRDGHLFLSDWQQVESLLSDASLADAWAEAVAQEQLSGQRNDPLAQSSNSQSAVVITGAAPSSVVSGFATTVVQPGDSSAAGGSRPSAQLEVTLDAQRQSVPAALRHTAGGLVEADAQLPQSSSLPSVPPAAHALLWPDARFLAPSCMQPAAAAESAFDPQAPGRFLTDLLASTLPPPDDDHNRPDSTSTD